MKKIPIYSICNLHNEDNHEIVVTDLRTYLQSLQSLVFPHRHSFYQILYITRPGGRHVIDFESYPVEKGTVFFLTPGQIHEWIFDNDTDGILVNFGMPFFSTFLANSNYLSNLLFFSLNGKHSVVGFPDDVSDIDSLFHQMLSEYRLQEEGCLDMLRALLLQVFILANRKKQSHGQQKSPYQYSQLISFEKLIEQFYTKKKLPKEYAEMLFITPNYLNTLCSKLTGRSAGDLIRNRILLEAKRLLVNSTLSVSEIAWELNFENNSYFSRFFKKYEGISPEKFKKIKHSNKDLI
ncbi:helix-turn-helix domain-containing protein [Chitinophaga oryziterrae]|uniref:Helix-turn-helix domain-containing protein n=1 Tax=Chitinophaga oryziterrae TaxID=1031224 RepID=A0A6N8JE73_9BACT|nr:helix-turn-helix domain-containing protein [Chitinophaga oryziterrae]MVT43553.1 helix-turn-helix domain-containing protein [Chitinophaga oryziterrae]